MRHATLSAEQVIERFSLSPHPEGGYYRETFRDSRCDAAGRARSTAIYFLLREGEESRWHRVDATEMWHWYAGSDLQLEVVENDISQLRSRRLGGSLLYSVVPQAIVPQGFWQRARALGAWTLVGCTVAPAFRFEGFELAPAGLLPDKWR